MDKYRQHPHRVLVAVPTIGKDGQSRLAGVFRWLGEGHYWDTRLIRARDDFTPEAVKEALLDGIDGAIVAIPYRPDTCSVLSKTTLPIVVMTTGLAVGLNAKRPRTGFSLVDNDAIGAAAARHFLELGLFASFAYVHDARISNWSTERLAGFKRVLATKRQQPLVFSDQTVKGDTIDLLPRDSLARFLSGLPRPAAVFAANDTIAEQVAGICELNGTRIPSQLSVLGVDNDELLCAHARPKLSSIEPDFNTAGYSAAEMLDGMMRGRLRRSRTLRTGVLRVVTRESTAPLTPATRIVSDAISFIRSRAFDGISSRDVIAHLKVSRSLANLRFREIQGESIGDAITRIRLDEAERLLKETDWPLKRIAAECGYSNPDVFRNLFRSRRGKSMSAFRAQSD